MRVSLPMTRAVAGYYRPPKKIRNHTRREVLLKTFVCVFPVLFLFTNSDNDASRSLGFLLPPPLSLSRACSTPDDASCARVASLPPFSLYFLFVLLAPSQSNARLLPFFIFYYLFFFILFSDGAWRSNLEKQIVVFYSFLFSYFIITDRSNNAICTRRRILIFESNISGHVREKQKRRLEGLRRERQQSERFCWSGRYQRWS